MDDCIRVSHYPAPYVNRKEILRYAGAGEESEALCRLLEECLQEAEGVLQYAVCWRRLPLAFREGELDLGFCKTRSEDLSKNLEGCESLVLFAATVGMGLDRLLSRYAKISPAKALLFQALGAERIESLCEVFSKELEQTFAREGLFLRPRFSPGYGDLPLEIQPAIFQALLCSSKIGLTLSESLLMSPSKSVTALVGLGKTPCRREAGCRICQKKDCRFRSDG